jgi:signal transduction histidine kinase
VVISLNNPVTKVNTPVNLLLVDDHTENLVVLESVLSRPGYQLTKVTSAQDTLMALMHTEFALIILDVEMPDMNGIELARAIKERPKTRDVPIIFLTAHYDDERDILSGYGAGAVDYVTKPLNPAILQSKVAVFVDLHHKSQALKTANAALQAEIIERKAMEQALQNATRLKSQFFANMSHELRTPLNAIIGFSEFMLDGKPGPLTAGQRTCLTDISNGGQHLLLLINDVLDLAKIEAGKMELSPVTFSVSSAIDEVCSVVKALADRKNIVIAYRSSPVVTNVTLDKQKFKQVLYNLLSNAMKFSEMGSRVEIAVVPHDNEHFRVTVKDSGIGIKPEDISRLFQEFEQLDMRVARQYEGSGLGLALTKKLIEIQRGYIMVESEFGKGSTFTAVLPLITTALIL